MKRDFRIEMVLYSHPWDIHMLARRGVVDPARDAVMIEVCEHPCLSILCPDRNVASNGPLPLLRRPVRTSLRTLARTVSLIPAPIVLAPNPGTDAQLVVDALAVLDTKTDDCEVVHLLCHLAHARRFAATFGIADRFTIVWDAAGHPSRALLDGFEAVAESGCLSEERWGGVVTSRHWLRDNSDAEENEALVHALLAEAGVA